MEGSIDYGGTTLHERKPHRLTALLLAATLAGTVMPAARAAAQPGLPATNSHAAVMALQEYGVIDRRPEGELRLDQPIIRAEVAKVLGAALKLQDAAAKQPTSPPFPDVAGHWAAGWIAVARDRGLFQGREDGRFDPQAPVTYAEALTALLRLTGYGQAAAVNWPWGAVLKAAELGMIPADMQLGGHWEEEAPRGDVFRLTAMAMGRIPRAGSGQTLAQAIFDMVPPDLALQSFPAVTGQQAVSVTGSAAGAVTVMVADQEAYLAPDGTFTAELRLAVGPNTVPVLAVDGAGNLAQSTVSILVQPLASLQIDPPVVQTAVGESFLPVVLRGGVGGQTISVANAAWSYDTTALTRDPATGTFKAARPGEYAVRATVEGAVATAQVVVADKPARVDLQVDQPTLVARGLPIGVTVRILDAQGRLNTAGSQTVQLNVTPTGMATFDQPSVTTSGGTARAYLVPGTAAGGFGIQADLFGVTQLRSPLVPLTVEVRRLDAIRLETVPANVSPALREPVTVIATAVDQSGAAYPVREDLTVMLSSSDGSVLSLTEAKAVIRAGSSSSDAGGTNGKAAVRGGTGAAQVSGASAGLRVVPARVKAATAGPFARLGVSIVREVAMADGLSATLVAVSRLDAGGSVATTDQTSVVLVPSEQGITVSPVQDAGGVALFAVRSTMAGRSTLTAGVPGRPELNAPAVTVAFVQSSTTVRPVLKTAAPMAVAGESVAVYVALEGYDGSGAANPGPVLRFTVQADGATMSAAEVTIPAGATRSKEIMVSIPRTATTVTINGAMVGGGPLNPAMLSVMPPTPDTTPPAPPGPNLIAVPSRSGRSPMAGEEVRFLIQAREGSAVLPGAYAFDLKVSLDGVELQAIPPTMKITIGNATIPYVTPRTSNGEAEVWVRYTGTGTVRLEPVPLAATWEAYDQWGARGPGANTSDFTAIAGEVSYTSGPLDHLDVRVLPNLGDSLQGVIKAARGRFAAIRLAAVDAYGNPAGAGCVATLSQVRATPAGSMMLRSGAADVTEQTLSVGATGYAEFSAVALTDREAVLELAPFMVCSSTPLTVKQNVVVRATMQSAPIPTIEYAGGDRSGEIGVRAADTALELRIARMSVGPDVAELLVYDGETMIARVGPVQPTAAEPSRRTVSVPKSLLGDYGRSLDLRVRLHTGGDVSEESLQRYLYFTLGQ
jgi:hypothetical protein